MSSNQCATRLHDIEVGHDLPTASFKLVGSGRRLVLKTSWHGPSSKLPQRRRRSWPRWLMFHERTAHAVGGTEPMSR
jgi:hypothetical protein